MCELIGKNLFIARCLYVIFTNVIFLFKENDDSLFLNEFTTCIKYTLVYSEKLAVDNILSFVSKYIAFVCNADSEKELSDSTVDESSPFLSGIIEFICKAS